ILRARSWFPDSFIRTVPVPGNVFSEPDEHLLRGPIKTFNVLRILRCRIDHFPIDVHLNLFAGRIANAHRPRIHVAAQTIYLAFMAGYLSEDRIQDAKLWLCQSRRVQQPCQKGLRLGHVAETDQSPNREGRVTEPAISVVPIKRITDTFWQRGGGA